MKTLLLSLAPDNDPGKRTRGCLGAYSIWIHILAVADNLFALLSPLVAWQRAQQPKLADAMRRGRGRLRLIPSPGKNALHLAPELRPRQQRAIPAEDIAGNAVN